MNKDKQLELPWAGRLAERRGQDERNMLEWVFGVLAESAPDGVTEVIYEDTIQTDFAADGKDAGRKGPLKRRLRIQVPATQKLPAATENDLIVALQELTLDQGNESPTVYFTIYDLCQRMRKGTDGRSYRRIREALHRLRAANIIAENAYFDAEGHRYASVSFSLIDELAIAERDDEAKSFITWSRTYWSSLQARYFREIDTEFYFDLKTPLEKRIFRYLNNKKHGNETRPWTIELAKLLVHLGVQGDYTPSQAKRLLDRAHKSLLRRGFLTKVEYTKNAKKEWQVSYTFGSRILLPPERKSQKSSDPGRHASISRPALRSGIHLPDRSDGSDGPGGTDTPEQPMLPSADLKAIARKAARDRAALVAQATDAERAHARSEALAWYHAEMPGKPVNEKLLAPVADNKLAEIVRRRLTQDAPEG